jgi:hypothetical protein
MTHESGEVVVKDLGSTNGIRINGQRVEFGRLRPGDELSIAHIRYRLENGQAHEQTIAEPAAALLGRSESNERGNERAVAVSAREPEAVAFEQGGENAFAAAVRKLLPTGVADKCRIQVIVQMAGEESPAAEPHDPLVPSHAPESPAECHSDSRH